MRLVGRWAWLSGLLLLLVSCNAFSANRIIGSPHNLGQTEDYNAVCVYCHPSHNSSKLQAARWNGQVTEVSGYAVYSTETLDTAPGQASRAVKLCLSCHDGAVAASSALNEPLTMTASAPASATSTSTDSTSDDHPVGIVYDVAADDLVLPPPDGKFPNGVQLIDGKVDCMSCHNPHDPTNDFLVTANNQSTLCRTCHVK